MLRFSLGFLLLICGALGTLAASWTLRNPTGFTYTNEAVRLHLPTPAEAFSVKNDGVAVPYQVEEIDGKRCIWVLTSMKKGESHTFEVVPGAIPMEPVTKPVSLKQEADGYVLDNGLVGIKVPLSGDGAASPITAVKLPDGTWVGKGYWKVAATATKLTATVTGDGTCFAKVRLHYDFPGLAGVYGKTPAYAEIDVALYPGQRHAVIEERHDTSGRDDAWEFDAAAGWGARTCRLEVFGGGAGRSFNPDAIPKTLTPLGTDAASIQARYDRGDPRLGDTLMWLIPRANQGYEDGWHFALNDGTSTVGVIPARAGKWLWPHDNKIAIKVKTSADYAGINCPVYRGSRYWFLLVGPKTAFDGNNVASYTKSYVYQGLDKILTDYITDYPGQDTKEGFYAGKFSPMGLKRGFMRGFGGDWGGGTPMDTLTAVQVLLDPDMYGDYWSFMSPTNPNFFTDFYKPAINNLDKLRDNPRYDDLKRLAQMKVAEDVYHSITMPGGAGQECPGYQHYALGTLSGLVNRVGATQIMPDAQKRIDAAYSFIKGISQPAGAGKRKYLQMGDTHPSYGAIDAGDVSQWQTQEFPGFGVIFHNNPGTEKETYLAFKSGPNRGHYHGDQLSFHYCANANPVAVDHHCSYGPRAGEEHMHNRLTFWTDDMPYANMDGYERVIALKTTPDVDVSIGQVESNRLRPTTQFPPEDWDRDYPQVKFDGLLQYRRTIVAMKNGAQDYFVIRDQYQGPKEVHAAFALQVLDDSVVAFTSTPGMGGTTDGTARFTDEKTDFAALGVKPNWNLYLVSFDAKDPTHTAVKRGLRIVAVEAHALTLAGKLPAGTNLGYALVKDLDAAADARSLAVGNMTLYRAWPAQATRTVLPWWHYNGGKEMTQGIRLETTGKSGEYITVIYPGKDVPAMQPVPGGVQVGADVVTFGGGIDNTDATSYVTVTRTDKTLLSLTGKEIDMDRSQGNIGLFVPDTGYPFGDIPDWLSRQRMTPPAWYKPVLPLGYRW